MYTIHASENIEDVDAIRIVVKERFGAGSDKIGINLDKEGALSHAIHLKNPIYQPFIAGYEISVDAYISNEGNVKGIIMRRRDLVVDGESQITSTINDKHLEKLFSKIINSLHLNGHIILQAIISNNRDVNVIECNPRFGGASTLSLQAGLDSFYWAYLESMNTSIVDYPFFRSQNEIMQVRYPQDLYI